MINITEWLMSVFGPYGSWGILLVVFLVFFIDALIFPMLPEIFFILTCMYKATLEWGLTVLVVVSIAEAAGFLSLYLIVEHVRVPERVKHIADKYSKFLLVHDEKMLLVNRIAPLLPFAGAFVSLIPSWEIKKALVYNVIGCYLKYGAILLFAGFFYTYFNGPTAQWVTIGFVVGMIIVCLIIAFVKKKKEGLIDESG